MIHSIIRGIDTNGELKSLILEGEVNSQTARKLGEDKGWREISLQHYRKGKKLGQTSKSSEAGAIIFV